MAPLKAEFPLVIFANAIGDHILTLPAFRALEHLYGERLGFTGHHLASAFLEKHKYRIFLDGGMSQNRDAQWTFDSDKLAIEVGPCDFLLSLNPWHSDAMDRFLRILSPDISIGFAPSFTISLPKRAGIHATVRASGA